MGNVRCGALAIGLFALALFATAGAPVGAAEVSVAEAKASTCGELISAPQNRSPGVVQRLRPPEGSEFLLVALKLKVAWGEKDKTVRIPADKIALVDAKGAEHKAVGKMVAEGHFQCYQVALYLRKPYNKKEFDKPHIFNAVFLVSKGATAFTLKVGDIEHKLTVAKRGKTLGPADFAAFTVKGAKFVAEATGNESLGYKKPKLPKTIRAAFGKLLAVTVEITPKRANAERGGNFYNNTWNFGLAFGKGGFAQAVGQEHGNFGFADNVSSSSHPEADGKWKPSTCIVYFPVPEDTTEFTLTYYMVPVAKGKVSP